MTNKDALQVALSGAHGVVLSENHFVKALIDVGLSPTGHYSDKLKINKAVISLYDVILGSANISEGDLSYSLNLDAIREARDKLSDEIGESARRDKVKALKVW